MMRDTKRPIHAFSGKAMRCSNCSWTKLIKQIDEFVTHYNSESRPFIWTAAADPILEKSPASLQ